MYEFILDRKGELLSVHSMKEYAEFLDISLSFLCQLLNGKKYTTKHLAYAISQYANGELEYYFKGVE